jgi:hypothetical protein
MSKGLIEKIRLTVCIWFDHKWGEPVPLVVWTAFDGKVVKVPTGQVERTCKICGKKERHTPPPVHYNCRCKI